MKNIATRLTGAMLIVFLPYSAYGQQAEAPMYKDGDWWKVKVELAYLEGSSAENCDEFYSEYLVKIQGGTPKIYGIGKGQEEIECTRLEGWLLGTGSDSRVKLKFPLRLGHSWSSSFFGGWRGRRQDVDYKVLAWENVQTPKGNFEAFKIRAEVLGRADWRFYYSPKVKAIVLWNSEGRRVRRKITLVDFKVSN